METFDLHHHYDLEELLKKGLAPFGVTPENIQNNWNRVRIIRRFCRADLPGLYMDVLVDDLYAFSILQEAKYVEVFPGITQLKISYEMFTKGE